ncbi:MAG TPA: hypothetical protein VFM65_08875 [Flavobacteriaceae bacterium]|nr:hypothetical protein [Flavobacteriaceae bacterium]
MKKIHVGFLMSYDYEKLKLSIPPVYATADAIFIALDKDLRTWSGQKFQVDPTFFQWVEEMDVDKKITFYRDDFYDPAISAIENDNRERHMLSLKMGIGNWLVQVDADEYFLNFDDFVDDLRKHDRFLENPEKTKVQFAGYLLNLYKYVDGGVLYIDKASRGVLATNFPNYKVARNTRQRIIYTKTILLHECVSRSEEAILQKFENWGHKHQIDLEGFMEKWRKVNKSNYQNYRDFFYIEPEKWKKLGFVEGNSIEEVNKNLDYSKIMPSNFYVWKKNFGQWFKFLFK